MYFKIKTDGAKNLHLTQKLAKQSLTGCEDDYNTVLGTTVTDVLQIKVHRI